MNNLFVPNEGIEEKIEHLVKKESQNDEDNVIVGNFTRGSIVLLSEFEEDYIEIAKRSDSTHGLCVHKGTLYDGGVTHSGGMEDTKYYIYDTLESEIIAQSPGQVLGLCSHKGTLYHAGSDGKVYDTFKGKAVAKRDGCIWALCNHNGKLYDAAQTEQGDEGPCIIRETFTDKIVAVRYHIVQDMGSHRGVLYDAGWGDKIFQTITEEEYKPEKLTTINKWKGFFSSGTSKKLKPTESKVVAEREGGICALMSHRGILYDSGLYTGGILETTTAMNRHVDWLRPMVSVPRKILEDYL